MCTFPPTLQFLSQIGGNPPAYSLQPQISTPRGTFVSEQKVCLKQHSQMNFDEWLLISNIPYPIWYFGGSDDNHREIRQSACNYDL